MRGARRARRAGIALVPLALGVAIGACSFIDHFPDVAPDPDPATTSGGTGGARPTTASSTSTSGGSTGGGMGGASTSSTSSTTSVASSTSSTTSVASSTSSTSSASAGASGSGGAGGSCVPSFEVCATAADENCDGLGCVGAHVASARFGDVGDQHPKAIAAAGSDAVLLGVASGAADLGLGVLPDLGDAMVGDLVLARYTSALSTVWQKRFADTAAGGVAVSPNGDVVLAGGAIGPVDFGGGVLAGSPPPAHDAVVARFDASGKHLWGHRWGDTGDQIASAVAVNAAGDTVFTGSFAGDMFIGPNAPLSSVGPSELFVARLDPAGNPMWSGQYGAPPGVSQGRAIAVDSAGNLIVAGYFTGSFNVGGAFLSQGAEDIFVAKLDPGGTPIWGRTFGGAGTDKAFGVAIGPGDAVFLTGGFRGMVTFGALPAIASPTLNDASGFLAKLDTNGTPLWVRSQSEPVGMAMGLDQQGLGVAVDQEGNAVIIGFASGTTVFDTANPVTSTFVAAGATDAFIAKYGPGGGLIWARLLGDASPQVGIATAIDPLGSIWTTGSFLGSIDFGGAPPAVLTSAGAFDIFLARLSP